MKLFNKVSEDLSILIDKINLITLIIILAIVIVASSLSYYFLANNGTGLVNSNNQEETISLADSFYFSIVTISSLGYGDYKPIGMGKLIASVEVLIGLIFIALVVAKLSSERQVRLIKLLYSSDHERRLKEFTEGLIHYKDNINDALLNHNQEKLSIQGKNIIKLVEGIKSYFIFQSKYGILLEFGNKGTIRKVIKNISTLAEVCTKAAKLPDTYRNNIDVFETILVSIDRFSEIIINNYNDDISQSISLHIRNTISAYNKYVKNSEKYPNKYKYPQISIITNELLSKVEKEIPNGQWDKDLHKTVATKVGISNNLAHKCINKLIDEKRIIKP